MPFLIPHALGADLRLAGVAGQLILPVWCVIAAALEAARGRALASVMWLVLVCAVLSNPDFAEFTPVAHTSAYWPLLPLFAVLVAAERWQTAAVVLGLIVVGRSTMAAGAPIFLLWIWVHRRPLALRVIVAFVAPIVLLILPFALWDPHALSYGTRNQRMASRRRRCDIHHLLVRRPLVALVRQTQAWTGSLVAAAILIGVALVGSTSAYPTLDFGRTDASRRDAAVDLGHRRHRVNRERSNAPADVVIAAQPVVAPDAAHQSVTAMLNGRVLATLQAPPGWQKQRPPENHVADRQRAK